MPHWAFVVAGLYGLLLVALMLPVYVLGLGAAPAEGVRVLGEWDLWAWVGAFALAQLAMLLVPVRVASRRPVSRRGLLLPIAVSASLAALLGVGLYLALDEVVTRGAGGGFRWAPAAAGAAIWITWAAVFWRASRNADPSAFIARLSRALLRGSILELLIAVPSHLIARSRDYCCAGIMTFIGLVFGLAVMLFSFGPGIFFLYAARVARLRREAPPVA